MNHDSPWMFQPEGVALPTFLDHRSFRQYSLADLQKPCGWLRQHGQCQPWRFQHLKEEGGKLWLWGQLSHRPPPLLTAPLDQPCWQQLVLCLEQTAGQCPADTAWANSPHYLLADGQATLLLPPRLQAFLLKRREPSFREQWVLPFTHPHWRGEAALSYFLACFLYHLLSGEPPYVGNEEELHEQMLDARALPLQLKRPLVADKVAQLVDLALTSQQQSQLPPLAAWREIDPHAQRKLDPQQRQEQQLKGERQQQKLRQRFRHQVNFRRRKSLFLTLAITLPLVAAFLYQPIANALKPPRTAGLGPTALLRSYYLTGFNQLDPEWISDATTGRDPTLKNDYRLVTQLFVTRKMRLAYENADVVVNPSLWEQDPSSHLPGHFPFGVNELEIEDIEMSENEAQLHASYTAYYPGDGSAEQAFTREKVSDLVRLTRKDDVWYLTSIERTRGEGDDASPANAGGS